jgi:hypothetical protein
VGSITAHRSSPEKWLLEKFDSEMSRTRMVLLPAGRRRSSRAVSKGGREPERSFASSFSLFCRRGPAFPFITQTEGEKVKGFERRGTNSFRKILPLKDADLKNWGPFYPIDLGTPGRDGERDSGRHQPLYVNLRQNKGRRRDT